MIKSIKTQLKGLFSQPTAPYREEWVLEYIKNELDEIRFPYFQDRWGNIFAGAKSPRELKMSSKVALVAHTDHPGFHILQTEVVTRSSTRKANRQAGGQIFEAKWHGGHPPIMKNSRMAIHHPGFPGLMGTGQVLSEPDKKERRFFIKLLSSPFQVGTTCFGAFDFPAYKFKKNLLETRVADDLAGAVIILSVIRRLSTIERKNFLGIFTTAEETGFKGTLGILKDKTLGFKNRVISLEASKQMDGAKIGSGPVIRLGDRRTLFDNDLIALIDEAAKGIKSQRRIMSGGTCEATAFSVFGIKAAGMAVPLGNYHNQKENGKPGPEQISLSDVENAVKILVKFYKIIRIKKELPSASYKKVLLQELKKSESFFHTRPLFAPRTLKLGHNK